MFRLDIVQVPMHLVMEARVDDLDNKLLHDRLLHLCEHLQRGLDVSVREERTDRLQTN